MSGERRRLIGFCINYFCSHVFVLFAVAIQKKAVVTKGRNTIKEKGGKPFLPDSFHSDIMDNRRNVKSTIFDCQSEPCGKLQGTIYTQVMA